MVAVSNLTITIIKMNNKTSSQIISQSIQDYLEMVENARSTLTAQTYKKALVHFVNFLSESETDPNVEPTQTLTEDHVGRFIPYLRGFSVATESLYLTAMSGFYNYLASERLADINLPRLKMFISARARRQGRRIPQFPEDDIETILDNVPTSAIPADDLTRLIVFRDGAFILTLADTGLRVHEACGLTRGNMNWNQSRAIIIGKGNKQAVVRFSNRSIRAIRTYLAMRQSLDGSSGAPLSSLPIFSRHDKAAGGKIKPISTTTGRQIVAEWVERILGKEKVGTITPHSFRHYFVTTVLRETGNLKKAQAFARHESIQITQRYTHLVDEELDDDYNKIFNV
jgi:site-specific recombinase XerD